MGVTSPSQRPGVQEDVRREALVEVVSQLRADLVLRAGDVPAERGVVNVQSAGSQGQVVEEAGYGMPFIDSPMWPISVSVVCGGRSR